MKSIHSPACSTLFIGALLTASVAGIGGCTGCGEPSAPAPAADSALPPSAAVADACPCQALQPAQALLVKDMKPTDVIVAVNGERLTRADLDVRSRQIAWQIEHASAKGDVREDQFRAMLREGIRNYVREWPDAHLLVQESKRLDCCKDVDVEKDARRIMLNTIQRTGLPNKTVFAAYPGGEEALMADARQTVWIREIVRRHIPCPQVTDEMIQGIIDQIEEENKTVRVGNKAKIDKLNDVRAKLLALEPEKRDSLFIQSAREVNEDHASTTTNGYWGVFTRFGTFDAVDPLELRAEVFGDGVGPGYVSSVVLAEDDGDGGSAQIAYVIRRIPGTFVMKGDAFEIGPDGNRIPDQPEKIELGHIKVFLEAETEIADVANLRGDLQRQLQNKAVRDYLEKVKETAKIVFPHGTDFWPKRAPAADSAPDGAITPPPMPAD